MGLLGISLIVASIVYAIIRPPAWLSSVLYRRRGAVAKAQASAHGQDTALRIRHRETSQGGAPSSPIEARDRAAMPPPPPPLRMRAQPPAIDTDSPTASRAAPMRPPQSIPSLSISDESPAPSSAPKPSAGIMPLSGHRPGRPPTLAQFPAPNSVQRARAPPASTGLALPPTHSSRPHKPSRKITLEPGHSPLDWARISGPNADLRGVPPSSPYLRVPPSMLSKQTGRKGKDAWMAINGKVYNVTPYAKFHPGGAPELMRGAGRDGTRLFGEIHPWVNYETMLAACLVGLLVDEPEAGPAASDMDSMD